MKLLSAKDHDLWCLSCRAEPDIAVQLMDESPGPLICPVCLLKAVGLLGVNVDVGPQMAFHLMRLTCGVES